MTPTGGSFRKGLSLKKSLSEVRRHRGGAGSSANQSTSLNSSERDFRFGMRHSNSNSSLSSECSIGWSEGWQPILSVDFEVICKSPRLSPLDSLMHDSLRRINSDFPFSRKKRNVLRKRISHVVPEMVEEEKIEEAESEYRAKAQRVPIMQDLNEFGRKGKRPRSLEARARFSKAAAPRRHMPLESLDWSNYVSETEEE